MDLSRIRERRRALGLTQQDVADLAGVSVRFLRELERGKASVRLDGLEAVLVALGLDIQLVLRAPHPNSFEGET